MPTGELIPIYEKFVTEQLKKLCIKHKIRPVPECTVCGKEEPACWKKCATCIGHHFIDSVCSTKPTYGSHDPNWCDEETRQKLGKCLDGSLRFIDWLLHLSKKRYRDHSSHQVFVGTLGWFLLNCRIAGTHGQTLESWIAAKSEFAGVDVETAWWLASLLHDHGYPLAHLLEVSSSLAGPENETLVEHTWALMGCRPDSPCSLIDNVYDCTLLDNLRKAVRDVNTDGRREQVHLVLEKLLGQVFKEDEKPHTRPEICYDHGVLAAANLVALVPHALDKITLKAAIRAIGIHSGEVCHERVDAGHDPLAFLLILCDELQEWSRPIVVRDEIRYESQQIQLGHFQEVDGEPEIGECLTAVFEYQNASILNDTKWNYDLFKRSKDDAFKRIDIPSAFPIKRIQYDIRIPHDIKFKPS